MAIPSQYMRTTSTCG